MFSEVVAVPSTADQGMSSPGAVTLVVGLPGSCELARPPLNETVGNNASKEDLR